MPTEFAYDLRVDSHDLLGAIDRASLLASDGNNIVKLSLDPDHVIISSKSQAIGSVEEEIESAFFKGEPLEISFSSKYVSDAIRAIADSKIKILFTGSMQPFIIQSIDDESLLQLVLPVRTY